MQVTITQPEIELAIRDYLLKTFVNAADMKFEFVAQRKGNGIAATISFDVLPVAKAPMTEPGTEGLVSS